MHAGFAYDSGQGFSGDVDGCWLDLGKKKDRPGRSQGGVCVCGLLEGDVLDDVILAVRAEKFAVEFCGLVLHGVLEVFEGAVFVGNGLVKDVDPVFGFDDGGVGGFFHDASLLFFGRFCAGSEVLSDQLPNVVLAARNGIEFLDHVGIGLPVELHGVELAVDRIVFALGNGVVIRHQQFLPVIGID